MATYAVGDVQGCYEPLRCLLDQVNFNPRRDDLWLVGDLVNRGPASLEVLRFVRSLKKHAKVVLGNHDLHLLAMAYGVRPVKSRDTLDAILDAEERDELIDWLRRQPLIYTDKKLGYTMVHAGIPHIWSLKKARRLAAEVEAALRGKRAEAFLASMYGNEPLRWSNTLKGSERLRTITNYLTRMRFCNAAGDLDLEDAGNTRSERPGYLPWFELRGTLPKNHGILFGHWAVLNGACSAANIHALDTGCVWGQSLSLLHLESGERHSCRCGGESPLPRP